MIPLSAIPNRTFALLEIMRETIAALLLTVGAVASLTLPVTTGTLAAALTVGAIPLVGIGRHH